MCPHYKSCCQHIHAAREGPFAQSRAMVKGPPPKNITQNYFPRKVTLILWMRMYKHGMVSHSMEHCKRRVG